jgi:hypothetical protein
MGLGPFDAVLFADLLSLGMPQPVREPWLDRLELRLFALDVDPLDRSPDRPVIARRRVSLAVDAVLSPPAGVEEIADACELEVRP